MELNRRELVAALLGSSVAALGCRSRGAVGVTVPGALVDTAVLSGHRLRQEPEASLGEQGSARQVEVVIVGAGAAGLSAAWRLAGAGVSGDEVVVCELDEAMGGTSRSSRNACTAFPWGGHYLPAPSNLEGPVPRLLREMGILTGEDALGKPTFAESALVAEPQERLFHRGTWYEGLYLSAGASKTDLFELERFERRMSQFARQVDGKGRRAFAVPMAKSSGDAEWTALDGLSMAQWLEQEGFRSPRLRWLVDYACRDEFGGESAGISAWAGIWYFAARQAASGERNEGFLTWPEGNAHLVQHLAKASGAAVHTRLLIHSVAPTSQGCWLGGVDCQTGAPWAISAKQVVLAVPRFVAARLVLPWRTRPPEFLSAFEYAPWVVANLAVSALPAGRGFPLAWDNVLYESKSLGYVVATHQRAMAMEVGPSVLTWYYPFTGPDARGDRERMLSMSYEEWEALVMADLQVPHPELRGVAQRLEICRWGHGMVRPRPGFLFGGARQQAEASLGQNLHFAHCDLGGMALFEEANWFGVSAAEKVLRGLGRTFQSWL